MEPNHARQRRSHLEEVGSDVQGALKGLQLKLEEACVRLDVQDGTAQQTSSVPYAQGVYRAVAAELEELAQRLRTAAEDNPDGSR